MPNTVKWHQYFAAQSAYLQHNPRLGAACHTSSPHEPSIILHGMKSSKLTIGRGHNSGVQVGRRNPRMSRQHFVIEYKPHLGYTLTVQSPNGVLVDRIMFMAGEHIPLVKGSMIEVLGTKLVFAGETPSPSLENQQNDSYTMSPHMISSSSSSETTTTSPITLVDSTSMEPGLNRSSSSEPTLDPVLYSTGTSIKSHHGSTKKKNITHTTTTTTTPDPSLLSHSDFLDTLIRLLANSRKTSMTILEIRQQLKQDRQTLMELIQTTACIGCIERTGNTADGTPKEHLYYYIPELDANDERRLALSQSRRGARKCALKDTQYYFRIPPKLPSHRTKHSVDNKRKHNEQQQQQQQPKKKRRSKLKTTITTTSSSHITTTTSSLTTSPNTTTTLPFSLSSDDDLSDNGFLTSGDEDDDKELTALFEDV